ncbi:MAG: thiosulfate oxidation carrier protein SoxY [Alphaproteobacteria bacterium]|nr:thiosulfate oxidation carrier protein SoxY [Alphaproteobacteria bacterium]
MLRKTLSRRELLLAAGAGALAAGLLPPSAPALADTAAVDDAIKKLLGDVKPQQGKIALEVPEVAESGANVPFTVAVQSPMTDKDHVKAIHVLAEGNPLPGVATFHLTPASGKAQVSLRMRLAKTQNVRAVAVMSDGQAFAITKEVKVTAGGCGG